MSDLLTKLASWRGFTAIVVGDFMLDQLVYGDAERLTADAPVPVLHARRTEEIPGGAANVCVDLAAMHGRVLAFGVVGDDAEGRLLRERLEASGIECDGLVVDPNRPTTVKRSLIGLAQHRHPQKMFRVDYESKEPIAEETIARLLERFDKALAEADVVAIEDYNKGVCTERLCQGVVRRCRGAEREVLVDPAAIRDYGKYRGCTAITPNRSEAEQASGLAEAEDRADARQIEWMAHDLQSQLDCQAVVLTLDKQGAMLVEADRGPVMAPTLARQVYDVTGAGDMILAALCAARANGIAWLDGVRFANAAAGLEVEVFGVQAIPFERIFQAVMTQGREPTDKARTLEEALVEVAAARREGKRIVFTNGCFDVLHFGHIDLLRRAKKLGDMLIVGLNSDDSVRRLKGAERPVHAEEDRVQILGELESVDVVVVFAEDTPVGLIERIRPDVLAKGADYSKAQVVGGDIVESYGGRVELIELCQGRSTTGTIERLRAR